MNIIHYLRRIVSPETPCIDDFVPDFRGKTLVLPGAGGRDVGTSMGWSWVVVGHVVNNPRCFSKLFFWLWWCFFVGKEKKRMETQFFWEEEPNTFLVFFFLSHFNFRILVFCL